MDLLFNLKAITFLGRSCTVICQNENGPCPLLAIGNVLLLQNRIQIHSDRRIIDLTELIQIIANAILEHSYEATSGNNLDPAEASQQIECVLNILPKLARGLDLNVHFDDVAHFEFTEEISVFDSLNIPLHHGWIVNGEKDGTTAKSFIKSMSYNHLVYQLVEYSSLCERVLQQPPSTQQQKGSLGNEKREEKKEAKMREGVVGDLLHFEDDVRDVFQPDNMVGDAIAKLTVQEDVRAVTLGKQETNSVSEFQSRDALYDGGEGKKQSSSSSSPSAADVTAAGATLGVGIGSVEDTTVHGDATLSLPAAAPAAAYASAPLSPPSQGVTSSSPPPAAAVDESVVFTGQERELLERGQAMQEFMAESATQLTSAGLHALYARMNDRQLAVFFRNNHFGTLFSYEGQLFVLMTDLGYQDHASVAWELLDTTNGSSELFSDTFIPSSIAAATSESLSNLDFSSLLSNTPSTPSGTAAADISGTIALPPASSLRPTGSSPPNPNLSDFPNPVSNSEPLKFAPGEKMSGLGEELSGGEWAGAEPRGVVPMGDDLVSAMGGAGVAVDRKNLDSTISSQSTAPLSDEGDFDFVTDFSAASASSSSSPPLLLPPSAAAANACAVSNTIGNASTSTAAEGKDPWEGKKGEDGGMRSGDTMDTDTLLALQIQMQMDQQDEMEQQQQQRGMNQHHQQQEQRYEQLTPRPTMSPAQMITAANERSAAATAAATHGGEYKSGDGYIPAGSHTQRQTSRGHDTGTFGAGTGTGARADDEFGGLLLTSEERDRQFSLMLQHEEDMKAMRLRQEEQLQAHNQQHHHQQQQQQQHQQHQQQQQQQQSQQRSRGRGAGARARAGQPSPSCILS